MQAPLAACRELAVDYNILSELLYVFEHKTQNILIYAPYAFVVFWHVRNIPQWFVIFVIIPPWFV